MTEDDDVGGELLRHLASAPAALKPLLLRHKRWAVYRALEAARADGLVGPGPARGTWQLTPEGQGRAQGPDPAPAPAVTVWPDLPCSAHLAVLPSPEHRALGRLIVLARTARQHYERHHASLVLYSSSGLRGKTWLGRWACEVLGADAGQACVHAVSESGRSLAARRKANGEIAAVRQALSGPVLLIDEWRRGSSEVRRLTTVLIHGDTSVPVEDESLSVCAVILLAMNSPAGAASPEAATGLDAAMIRRCLVVDLERVQLEATFARDGEERLDRVRALGPLALPTIALDASEERALRDRVADLLPLLLDSPERTGALDLVLLGQLAAAACAWGLSPEDAVTLVLHDAATLWTTTSWTAPGWEGRLLSALGRPGGAGAVVPVDVPVAPAPAGSEDVSELDWWGRVDALDRVAREHGLSEPEELRRALDVAAAADGGSPDDVRRAMEIWRGLDGLPWQTAPDGAVRITRCMLRLDGPGGGQAETRRRVLARLDSAGLDVVGVAELALEAQALGWGSPGDAAVDLRRLARVEDELGVQGDQLEQVVAELRRLGGDPAAVVKSVLALLQRAKTVRLAVEEREARLAARERRLRAVNRWAEEAERRFARLKTVLAQAEDVPELAALMLVVDARAARAAFSQVVSLPG